MAVPAGVKDVAMPNHFKQKRSISLLNIDRFYLKFYKLSIL